jgi:hypothetical protein
LTQPKGNDGSKNAPSIGHAVIHGDSDPLSYEGKVIRRTVIYESYFSVK